MSTSNSNSNNLNPIPLKDYYKSKGFTQIHNSIRANEKGYPYITFIDGNNKAENIYFTKSATKKVVLDQVIDSDLLKSLYIVDTINSDGEARTKLSFGDSMRLSLDELFS